MTPKRRFSKKVTAKIAQKSKNIFIKSIIIISFALLCENYFNTASIATAD